MINGILEKGLILLFRLGMLVQISHFKTTFISEQENIEALLFVQNIGIGYGALSCIGIL
ncbi:MAG: hypothetical protein MJB12_12855 [Firmicutes bacterium]|nr:hypothetical protein [Bacillota bacterium]